MIPAELAHSRYVCLVTFRRDGTPVPTPVWAVGDEGELLVWTRENSGKVRRLRDAGRVSVTPCDVRGRVPESARPAEGRARLLESGGELSRVRAAMAREYGWQSRLIDSGGALLGPGRRPHAGIAITF